MSFTEESFSFVQQFPAEPARKREQAEESIEREQCDYCQECLPPGQNWRQGMSHHVIFKVHLLCNECQQSPKTPFLKQEAKEDTEYNFILVFTVFYFVFYHIWFRCNMTAFFVKI